MIILGLGGLLGDAACAVLKDGELIAAVEESKLTRRTHRGAASCRERAIAACLRAGRRRAASRWIASRSCGRSDPAKRDFHLQLRARVSQSRIVVVEHHRRTRRRPIIASPFDEATVLTLDHAGDFRCGARWQAHGNAADARKRAVLPGFARRSVRPRDRAAGFRAERRRAQSAVALGRGRRPLRALFLEMSRRIGERSTPRSHLLQHRAHQRTAASARSSSSGWDSTTARQIPAAMRAAHRRRHCRNRRRHGPRAGGRRRESVPGRRLSSTRCWSPRSERSGRWRMSSCSPRRGTPARRWARCSTSGISVYRQTERVSLGNAVPRARATPPKRSSRCWRTASCASNTC